MFENNAYRLPAEWEPQSGVQLTWPHRDTDWAPMLGEILGTYREMAWEISLRERVMVVAPEGAAPGMLHVVCPTNDTWARDHGFITLVPRIAGLKPRLMDYRFDGWGGKFPAEWDNAINRRLYEVGAVEGEYCDCLDFVLEGGSIESDGQGTLLTTTSCLLDPHRRSKGGHCATKEEVERRLLDDLQAERIVWIDHGRLTGDDTDGHIDTLVRMAPDDTLLYVGCSDRTDEQYEELQLMEEQLHGLRTLGGKPYRMLKLPMPAPIYEKGERLPATYANFLVVNGAVICPTYGQPLTDVQAMGTIAAAFPGRDIVGIDCRTIIRQHGSLHCCTMQFPAQCLHS